MRYDQMPPSSRRRSKRSCAKSTRSPQRGQQQQGGLSSGPASLMAFFSWAARARVAQYCGSAVYIGAAYIVADM